MSPDQSPEMPKPVASVWKRAKQECEFAMQNDDCPFFVCGKEFGESFPGSSISKAARISNEDSGKFPCHDTG